MLSILNPLVGQLLLISDWGSLSLDFLIGFQDISLQSIPLCQFRVRNVGYNDPIVRDFVRRISRIVYNYLDQPAAVSAQ